MKSPIKVLLLEDNTFDAELVDLELRDAGLRFEIIKVDEKKEFKKLLEDYIPDIILADFKLPGWNALDALKFLKEKSYDIPLILVTGTQTEQVAAESMKLGAVDYFIKDSLKRLPNAVINAIKNKEFERAKFNAEKALRAEFNFRKTIEDSMLAGVTTYDTNFIQTYVNTAFCKMIGWTKEDLIGKRPPFIYWTVVNKEKMLENIYSHSQKNIPTIQYETKFQNKDGRLFDVHVLSSAMKDSFDNITGWVEVVYDITEQKRKEKLIKASLKEKEVLLKEIHHRVKNNMQIISSLLSLQAGYLEDEKVQEVFNESRNRIKALALIHENIYKSKELTQINFKNYIKDLVNNLFLTYKLSSNKFKFIQD
jgi:PAS domain S-box-containing protein